MWAHFSSFPVMSTDGWSLFCVDTESRSSQLGPPIDHSHTSLTDVRAKETKSLRWVAVEDLFSTLCPPCNSLPSPSMANKGNSIQARWPLWQLWLNLYVKLLCRCRAVHPSLTISNFPNISFHCEAPTIYIVCLSIGHRSSSILFYTAWMLKDTCSRGRYVFRSTAQRPPVCLQVSGQLAGLYELFGDWPQAKRWRRIVMLMHLAPAPLRGSSSYVLIDWAQASVALFNPVGLAQGLLTHSMRCPRRWQEDLPLILADIGGPGRQGCNWENVKLQFDAPEHDCAGH